MSKFWTFFSQIYTGKIKSTSFIVLTCVYILIACSLVFWNDIKSLISDKFVDDIAIVNETNTNATDVFKSDASFNFHFLKKGKDVEKSLSDGEFDAVIKLSDVENQLHATIVSNEAVNLTLQLELQSYIETLSSSFIIDKLSLSEVQTNIFLNSTPVITTESLLTDVKSAEEKNVGQVAAYVSGFLIFIFVTNYLAMIVTNIATEKGSRNLEMLLVNVRPETHFKAKLVGVFAIAMTQFLILLVVMVCLIVFVKDGLYLDVFKDVVSEISVSYFVYTLLFLVLTLAMFLIVGGLFGSLVSKVDEANQISGPVVILIVISFYVMLSGLSNPDTLLIKIFSYLPFSSGMVMPMRMGATDIPTFEVIISMGILLLSTVVTYLFAISFYKRSVLTYSSGGVLKKIKSVFKYTS